jgi:hypothetical protein
LRIEGALYQDVVVWGLDCVNHGIL